VLDTTGATPRDPGLVTCSLPMAAGARIWPPAFPLPVPLRRLPARHRWPHGHIGPLTWKAEDNPITLSPVHGQPDSAPLSGQLQSLTGGPHVPPSVPAAPIPRVSVTEWPVPSCNTSLEPSAGAQDALLVLVQSFWGRRVVSEAGTECQCRMFHVKLPAAAAVEFKVLGWTRAGHGLEAERIAVRDSHSRLKRAVHGDFLSPQYSRARRSQPPVRLDLPNLVHPP